MKELEVLTAAKAAGDAVALALWERDEHQDRGSCGGAMLELDGRSKLAKVARDMGILSGSTNFVSSGLLPEGIRTQNADIYQGHMRAFREKLIEAGYGKTIKRFWTYID